MSHSVNAAAIKALESGAINSGSIMVPCPWFPEIAEYAKTHPEADLGLHLTLTSERTFVRWGPVASKDSVPSLVENTGYFHQTWEDPAKINPQDVDHELRAQIDRALAMGVRPTHLDSHQFRLYESGPQLFAVALRVAHDYRLPLLIPGDWFDESPDLKSANAPGDIVIDHLVTIMGPMPPAKWPEFYSNAIKSLQPGVTEFVIHLAYDNDEFRAMTSDRDSWGAAWRQRDFDFFTCPAFRKLLAEQNVGLITWRDLAKLQKP